MTRSEYKYWQLIRAAGARHCRDAAIEPLRQSDANALRRGWHKLMGNPESHTTWNNHDYSVAFAWLEAFVRGGETAAALVDIARVRDESIRRSSFWVISQHGGLDYWAPYAREQLHLESWDQVNWLTIPTNILRRVAMTASNRSRPSRQKQRTTEHTEHTEPGTVVLPEVRAGRVMARRSANGTVEISCACPVRWEPESRAEVKASFVPSSVSSVSSVVPSEDDFNDRF